MTEAGGDFRAGEPGYWSHWWEALQSRERSPAAGGQPLRMDVITDGAFAVRDWLLELDRDIVSHVVDAGLIRGRVIVPPATLERPAEDLLAVGMGIGFEVRALEVGSSMAIYDGEVVVLPDTVDGVEGHRAFRQPPAVAAIVELFELRWALATRWDEHRKGAVGVLELLARGMHDTQIAAELGLSVRSVSRRVATAMDELGASSRFELGMRYGLSRRDAGAE